MATDNLTQLASELSPEERDVVLEFIRFLKGQPGKSEESPFLAAVEEFIAAHPELLRRLAQ
jgi:hypothetical protein